VDAFRKFRRREKGARGPVHQIGFIVLLRQGCVT
jgi:hypothetical protein